MKDRICTSCGFVGKPIKQCFESFFVDAFLWAGVGTFVLVTSAFPLLVVPVAWTIFHLVKFRTTKCPKCGDLEMVSMDSRKGHVAMDKKTNPVKVWVNKEAAQH